MKNLLFIVLVAISLAIGYNINYWWKFIPSTVLILALTRLFFPENWIKYLGVRVSKTEVTGAILLCALFFFIARSLILWSLPEGYDLVIGYDGWGYMALVTTVFQALNEELVFRGLMIQLFLYWKVKRWVIIIVPGVIFSLLHWFFYKYSLSNIHSGILGFPALITLAIFGASAGMIYLRARNILMPWALHMAWNFNRFSLIRTDEPYKKINEASSFNLLEGAPTIVALSFILLFASYLFYKERKSVQ